MGTRWWTCLACFILCTVLVNALDPDALPGWLGETYHISTAGRARSLGQGVSGAHTGGKVLLRGDETVSVDPTKVIQLSWKPRAFLYKGFLSEEECDHLVELATPKLARSTVVDSESGASVLSEIRTSAGMFLQKYHDAVVKKIEERIAAWTFLPKENGEALQVLRYNLGQKYEAHYDVFDEEKKEEVLGGNRVATVLMYLSHVEHGGETVFPNSEKDSTVKDDSWSDCGKRGVGGELPWLGVGGWDLLAGMAHLPVVGRALYIKPKYYMKPIKGDALLFWSLNPDATQDFAALHTGCPVIRGEKWSATKWIHVRKFDENTRDPTLCENNDSKCEEWAKTGECEKNVAFMIGEGYFVGSCRKACQACPVGTT